MAYASTTTTRHLPFAGTLLSLGQTLREAIARRRAYTTTLRELSDLTDRELADIGVARGDIAAVAVKHAFGA